jgi:hypothetical protein
MSGNKLALQELRGILESHENEPRSTLQFKLTAEPNVPHSYSLLVVKLQSTTTWQISIEPEINAIVLLLNQEFLKELCETIGHAVAGDNYCQDYSVTSACSGINPKKLDGDVLDITCSK